MTGESKLMLASCRGIIYIHHVVLQEEFISFSLHTPQSFICTSTNSWNLFYCIFFVLLVKHRPGGWLFLIGSHASLTYISFYGVYTCLNLDKIWQQKYSELAGLDIFFLTVLEVWSLRLKDLDLGRIHFLVYRFSPPSHCALTQQTDMPCRETGYRV